MIHRSEFQPADVMKYVKEVGGLDPKVKGRHSNQTFIDFPVNDRVAVTLDMKWVRRILRLTNIVDFKNHSNLNILVNRLNAVGSYNVKMD